VLCAATVAAFTLPRRENELTGLGG
jgi:hypothetical protein